MVDKIDQFAAELADPAIVCLRQLLALKFLLHLVGACISRSTLRTTTGGNKKVVSGEELRSSNLHHYWDVEFVERLGTDPRQVAAALIGQISEAQRREWPSGTPADWAMEAFALGRGLRTSTSIRQSRHIRASSGIYRAGQHKDVALQLNRAGVRLAFVLDRAFTASQ